MTIQMETSGSPLPPIQAENLNAQPTPVETDGSFSMRRIRKQAFTTPVDASTGVPLPIYPSEDLPPVIWKKEQNNERLGDWHHPFHPRAALIHGTIAQQALRGCRVQWVKYEDHHDGVGYHQTFAGPEIPTDELQIFKTVVFACAGFIGNHALAFEPDGQHSIQEMGYLDRKKLLALGVITIDDLLRVNTFLVEFGTKHSIQHANPNVIDQLLHSSDLEVKKRLAGALITEASEEVTSQFSEEFRHAKRETWLPKKRTANAASYVRNLLTIQRDGSRIVNKQILKLLEHSLQAS